MDRVCIAIIDKICSLAEAGRYVVFSEDELFDAFPDDEPRDDVTLKKALVSLKDEDYIDLKFSGGNLYCIAALKAYEPLPEPVEAPEPEPILCEPERTEKIQKTPKLIYITGAIALAAFFGGVLGSVLATLIAAVI